MEYAIKLPFRTDPYYQRCGLCCSSNMPCDGCVELMIKFKQDLSCNGYGRFYGRGLNAGRSETLCPGCTACIGPIKHEPDYWQKPGQFGYERWLRKQDNPPKERHLQ